MREITEKYLMQVAKHVFVEIFVQCQLRVSLVLLRKFKFLCPQPYFNILLCWIQWPKHSLLGFHPPCFCSTDPIHSILCSSNRKHNNFLVTWADPSSDLKYVYNKTLKTIGHPGKLEGNSMHRVPSWLFLFILYGISLLCATLGRGVLPLYGSATIARVVFLVLL
jgi:hypothetical protein